MGPRSITCSALDSLFIDDDLLLFQREGICGRMPEEIEWGQDHHLMVLGVWQSFKTLLAGDLACGRDPSVGMSSRTQLRSVLVFLVCHLPVLEERTRWSHDIQSSACIEFTGA